MVWLYFLFVCLLAGGPRNTSLFFRRCQKSSSRTGSGKQNQNLERGRGCSENCRLRKFCLEDLRKVIFCLNFDGFLTLLFPTEVLLFYLWMKIITLFYLNSNVRVNKFKCEKLKIIFYGKVLLIKLFQSRGL